MKKMLVILTLLFSSSLFAAPRCIDLRIIMLAPPPAGQKYFFHQGKCPGNTFEHIYTANIDSPKCIDSWDALLDECPEGSELTFIQGRCESERYFENTFCSKL